VEFDVVVGAVGLTKGADQIVLLAPQVKFPAGSSVNAKIKMTVDLRDVNGAIDLGGKKSQDMAVLKGAAVLSAEDGSLAGGTEGDDNNTVVDVNVLPPRTEFAPDGVDDVANIARATILITNTTGGVLTANAAGDHVLGIADQITLRIEGDFTGLDADNFCFDLDRGSSATNADCDTTAPANEKFTIVDGVATLTFTANLLDNNSHKLVFQKEAGVVLNAPRSFSVSASITPVASSQARGLSQSNSTWWNWSLNGAVLTSTYIAFIAGNETKFRCTNSSSKDFLIFPEVVLDQGTFTLTTTGDFGANGEFTVPANGNVHVELSNPAAAGTGAIGPLVTLNTGQQPVRGRAIFTALTTPANVSCTTLIASPVGVVSVAQMPKQ
jgi:hypothetical protein